MTITLMKCPKNPAHGYLVATCDAAFKLLLECAFDGCTYARYMELGEAIEPIADTEAKIDPKTMIRGVLPAHYTGGDD